MAQQTINVGAAPNDGTGTPLRTAFQYTNSNFSELYTALGGGVGLPGATTQVIFNDGGTNLAGDAGLVYNKTTDALTIGGNVQAASATITGAATVGTTLGVTGALSAASLALSGAGAAFTATSTSGNSLNQIQRPTNVTAGGIQFKTSSTNDWIMGLRETGDSDFHLFSYGTVTDVLTVARSTGNVNIIAGNVVMGTSGKGIDFSATSEGSGTMTSELLNDYEEGTFTPTVTSVGGTGIVYTPVGDTGTYTKIGRLVTFTVNLYGTYTGTFTYVRIALPFTVGAVNDSVNGFNGSTGAILGGRTDSTAARFLVFSFQASGETGIYTGSYNV